MNRPTRKRRRNIAFDIAAVALAPLVLVLFAIEYQWRQFRRRVKDTPRTEPICKFGPGGDYTNHYHPRGERTPDHE